MTRFHLEILDGFQFIEIINCHMVLFINNHKSIFFRKQGMKIPWFKAESWQCPLNPDS